LIKQLSEKVQNAYLLRKNFKNLADEVRNKGQHLTFEDICKLFDIRPKDIKFDYVISSDPPQNPIKEVETFIKTLGKVYISGSELKGAFRTAYAYHLLVNNESYYKWFENKLEQKLNEIRYLPPKEKKKKLNKFAQRLENYLFSSEAVRSPATVDIFKLVHIGDSELKEPQEVLTLKNIRLLGSSKNLNVWSECIKPTSKWSVDIKVQKEVKEYLNKLFKELEEKDNNLDGELQLLKIVDNFFRDFIDFELERLEKEIRKPLSREKETYMKLKGIYQQLKAFPKENKKVHNILLRVGKHTGRYHHTVLLALWKRKSPLLQEVLRTFPSKTRWVTMENYPLGWMFLPVPEKG
jgi:CRISPR type III-A-associated RAMP protein Csm5